MRRTPTRLTLLALAVTAIAAGACQKDDISGPSKQIGPPLLDVNLTPAGNAVYPSASSRITTVAARDTVDITFGALPPTPAGGSYQVVIVDTTKTTANVTPLTGRLIRSTRFRRPVNRDSSVFFAVTDTTNNVSQIAVADTNQSFRFIAQNAAIATGTHVIVRVANPVAAAGTLGATEWYGFLSGRYRSGTTFTTTTALTFGRWSIASAQRLPFSAQAVTSGGFWGDQVRFNFRNLIRPPVGFKYAAWLLDSRTGIQVRLGELVTGNPENAPITDADVGTGANYSPVSIINSQIRGNTATIGVKPEDYDFVTILLEPVGTANVSKPGLTYVMAASIPLSVSSRSATPGKLFGTVTGTNVVGTTIHVTGATSINPLLITNAAANGSFAFRAIPTGTYKVYATPVGLTSPRDSVTVTIGSRRVNGVLTGDSTFVTLRKP